MKTRGGERLMIGFPGTRAESAVEILEATGASALILMSHNLESAVQTHALIREIRAAMPRPLLIAIDQEGGRVVRLEQGVTVFPGNRALAACGSLELAERQGYLCGMQLAALGIDMNLAPVVDLDLAGQNPALGSRSFGADVETVFGFASCVLRGQERAGIASCLKHFPGLGTARVDPHVALATRVLDGGVERDPQLVLFRRLIRAFRGHEQTAVMSTHLLVLELDPQQPATLSVKIAHDLLRGSFGFSGLLIADDIEMGALEALGGPGELAIAAALAGHDLMPFCHSPDQALIAAAALDRALGSGQLSTGEQLGSVARIRALAQRSSGEGPIDPAVGDALARDILAGA